MRAGYGRALFGPLLPLVLGREFAGTVVHVGGAARRGLALGDRVFGVLPPAGEAGAYAEYVAARSDDVAHTPPGWTHEARATKSAAAAVLSRSRPSPLPRRRRRRCRSRRSPRGARWTRAPRCRRRVSARVALRCRQRSAQAPPRNAAPQGESLLVLGAGGAVGGAAVQLAAAWGCRVHATARQRSAGRVAEYGAASVADADAPLRDEAKRLGWPAFDAALDTVGGAAAEEAAAALLRPHAGRLVTVHGGMVNAMDRHGVVFGAAAGLAELAARRAALRASHDVSYSWAVMRADGDALAEIARLAAAGALRSHVGAVLPLERAAEAHALVEQSVAGGKVVLSVAGGAG